MRSSTRPNVVVMALILPLLVALASGCGVFGRTKAQSIALPSGVTSDLELRSVTLEPGQTHLQNVGTFAVGEYDARDLAALEETIRTTFGAPTSDPEYGVHIVVRRFLVAHSNNEGFAVACVAWALTDAEGSLRFHEQFYASDYVKLWGTVGGLKNHVHEGITRHIAQQASRVAAGHEPAEIDSPYTYSTYEAAISRFPAQLTSVHFQMLYLGGGYSFRSLLITDDSHRDWARGDEHIDWDGRL